MSEWKDGYFLDYIELNPKVSLKKGDWYPFVDMASVDSVTRIPTCFEQKQYTSGVKFQKLDTVFARIEPCLQNGKRFLFKDFLYGFGSTEFLVFRAIKDKTVPLFVYYYMQTHRIKNIMINSMTGATGRQRVNNDVFNHLIIKIPSLSIQTRVSEILSRYDALIENYQKQIKLLEESAQCLYKEWFVDLRFPGHENTKIENGVPEGWEKKEINEFISILSGYAFKSSSFVEDGDYKIVTIKNVQDGFFDGKNLSHIREIPNKMPKHCFLATGDLLLSLTGNIGRVCMIIGNNYLLNQRVAKIESVFPAFAYCLFRSEKMFSSINNLANGAAQQNVSPIKIGTLKIIVNNEIISKFETVVGNIRNQILVLYSQIEELTEARDRLLPKLMNPNFLHKLSNYGK